MGTLSCTHTQPCGWHGQRGFPRVSCCLHQGCLRALFSSLKTACSPSTAYHQGEHPHQIFRICGYMVNSVFNFLTDTGPCWSPFSLLRPTQKEGRVCFHSQFKGAVAMGVGRSMAAGRRGLENWCPLHLPFLFRSRWHPHSEWILSPHPDLDNPTQGGPSLCLIHQDPVKPTTNINQF